MRIPLLAISVICLSVATLLAAEPPARAELKPVFCQIRLLEGRPDGNEAQGTLRILAEPKLVTTETRAAEIVVGGEVVVPGTKEKLPFGINLRFTPEKFDKGAIIAKVALEVSHVVDLKDKSLAASQGDVVRAVGVFTCGKPVRILARELGGGKQLWAEITLDSESKLPIAKNLPAAKYQEIPTAKAREKSSAR